MTNQLDSKSWTRVVAIFIRGSSYELKNIPNAQSIGKKMKAYHFKFEQDPPKDALKQWQGLKVFDLHRSKRHLDKSIMTAFWEDFEDFLLHPAIN